MPIQIPKYSQQVADPAMPTVRQRVAVTPDDFGAGVAKSAEFAGRSAIDAMERMAAKEKEKQKGGMSWFADTRFNKEEADMRTAFSQIKGKDVAKQHQQYSQDYEKMVERIAGDIEDDDVRAAFYERARGRHGRFVNFLHSHTNQQLDNFAKDSAESAANSSTDMAVRSLIDGDEDEFAAFGAEGEAKIREYATIQGVNADAAVANYTTNLHTKAIESLLEAGQPERAQRHLADFRDEIGVDQARKLEKGVDAAVIGKRSREIADELWESTLQERYDGSDLAPQEGDVSIALAKLRKMGLDDALQYETEQQLYRVSGAHAKSLTMADVPLLGEIEVRYRESKGRDRGTKSVEFMRLSVAGKARWLRTLEADDRAKSDRWRKWQAETDQFAVARFDAMDVVGQDGADQYSVDISKMFANVTGRTRELLIAKQKKVQRVHDRSGGVGVQGMKVRINDYAVRVGMNEKQAKTFSHLVMRDYINYMDDDEVNPNKAEPQAPLANKWIILHGARGEAPITGADVYAFEEGDMMFGSHVDYSDPDFKKNNADYMLREGVLERDVWLQRGFTEDEWRRHTEGVKAPGQRTKHKYEEDRPYTRRKTAVRDVDTRRREEPKLPAGAVVETEGRMAGRVKMIAPDGSRKLVKKEQVGYAIENMNYRLAENE